MSSSAVSFRRGASLRDVAIAGVGVTRQAKQLDSTSALVCLEAAQMALADAGVPLAEVDGVSARWPGPGGSVFYEGSVDWSSVFGHGFTWVGDTYPQGAPGLLDAASAIIAGQCDTALVFGGRAGESGDAKVAAYTRPDNEFVACWGSLTAAQFALVAQVYMHRFAPDPERMAAIPAAIRNAGSLNPAAIMHGRGPYTPADVLASPPVAEPFHLLDLCLASEGAAAILVTTLERARDCRHAPVVVLGGACEWQRQQYVNPPRYDEVSRVGASAMGRALAMAALSASDVDAFELYDINTFEVVRQFEALGLCAEGEGVDYLAEVGIGVDGKHPTNTDGGLMSYSHTGFSGPTMKIVEAVRQIRGSAGAGQIPGAEVVLATGAGSGAEYHNTVVLAADR